MISYPLFFQLQFCDNAGGPIAYGKVVTKRSSNNTDAITYDENGDANTNPVTLDAAGRAVIQVDITFGYKFEIYRPIVAAPVNFPADYALVYERDNIVGAQYVGSLPANVVSAPSGLANGHLPYATGTDTLSSSDVEFRSGGASFGGHLDITCNPATFDGVIHCDGNLDLSAGSGKVVEYKGYEIANVNDIPVIGAYAKLDGTNMPFTGNLYTNGGYVKALNDLGSGNSSQATLSNSGVQSFLTAQSINSGMITSAAFYTDTGSIGIQIKDGAVVGPWIKHIGIRVPTDTTAETMAYLSDIPSLAGLLKTDGSNSMTGALNGTTASFSGGVSASAFTENGLALSAIYLKLDASNGPITGKILVNVPTGTVGNLVDIQINSVSKLSLDSTGKFSLPGATNTTSAFTIGGDCDLYRWQVNQMRTSGRFVAATGPLLLADLKADTATAYTVCSWQKLDQSAEYFGISYYGATHSVTNWQAKDVIYSGSAANGMAFDCFAGDWSWTTAVGATKAMSLTRTGVLTLLSFTASTVPYIGASKQLVSSAVTPTELGYLSGVTGPIQTQFGGYVKIDGTSTMTDNLVVDKSAASGFLLNLKKSAVSALSVGFDGKLIINAPTGTTGNLLDIQLNAASKASIDYTGAVIATSYTSQDVVTGNVAIAAGYTMPAYQDITIAGTDTWTINGTLIIIG